MNLIIIGFGELGQAFYRASKQTNTVKVVGYHDMVKSNLPLPMEFFSSLETLVERDVDGYIVTAPQDKQEKIALFLAKTGRKIVMPLPLANNAKSLVKILEAVPSNQLFIAPLNCYQRNIQALKNHLGQNVLGTIGIAEFSQTIGKLPQEWYQDISISGGCRYQLLLPLLCEIFFLLGESKASFGYYSCSGSSDYANCSLQLNNGVLVCLEVSWGTEETNRKTIELSGQKGNVSFDSLEANPALLISKQKLNNYWDASFEGTAYNPIKLFLDDFALGKQLFTQADVLRFQTLLDSCDDISEAHHE